MNPVNKKILYIVTKSNGGGAQKYVYDLATSLPNEVLEPTVAFGGEGVLAEKLKKANIKTISIKSLQRDISLFRDVMSFFALLSIIKKEKPNIVHVNSSKVGGLGALAARIRKVPHIIFTCHGWPFNEDRGTLSRLSIRFLSWLTVMLAHTTIVVSEKDLYDGQRMLWAAGRLKLIHNGIKEPVFKDRKEAREFITEKAKENGLNIEKDSFLIGAMGELHKNKGYEYMLEAMTGLNKGEIFVAMGEGEERAHLENYIKNKKLNKKIALVGFVKDSVSYLKAFDAFILTSIKEGLPYVIIESGFAGLATIATSVGGIPDIINDMKSGILVRSKNVKDIRNALEFLHNNLEIRQNLGNALHQKVSSEFSLKKMIDETMVVYNKN